MATAFRIVERYSHPCADLERSVHPEGSTVRNWRLAVGALPIELARIRCDFGNGLITDEERAKLERDWHRASAKRRREARAAR